jgi:HTH-type transcriptional regulator, competence development regulator
MSELGKLLARERNRRGWSLREAERRTGIHNAHLSQLEKGVIVRPAPAMLHTLAAIYELDFRRLMRLGGHTEGTSAGNAAAAIAFRTVQELPPKEQQEALKYLSNLRRRRGDGHTS